MTKLHKNFQSDPTIKGGDPFWRSQDTTYEELVNYRPLFDKIKLFLEMEFNSSCERQDRSIDSDNFERVWAKEAGYQKALKVVDRLLTFREGD